MEFSFSARSYALLQALFYFNGALMGKKPFFFRIDLIDLMDFATDPDGENMSLLTFAKELKKGESVFPQIQKIIEEANNYIEKKKNSGRSGGKKRVQNQAKSSGVQAVFESAQAKSSGAQVKSSELKPEAVTEAVTVTEEQKTKRIMGKIKHFSPPSIEDVLEYCLERGKGIDAESFIDYYTANGWMVGKNRMKDWKAAVRTWEKNGYHNKNQSVNIQPRINTVRDKQISDRDKIAKMLIEAEDKNERRVDTESGIRSPLQSIPQISGSRI
jgi:hypothetical protein